MVFFSFSFSKPNEPWPMSGRFYALLLYCFVFLQPFFPTSWLFVSILDNEHIFIDMEEKLTKYFAKDWRQDSVRVRNDRFWSLQLVVGLTHFQNYWMSLLIGSWRSMTYLLTCFCCSITKRRHRLFWHLFLQGSLRRPFPLLLFLKVQYYVENGRLFWYVVYICSVLFLLFLVL